MSPRDIGVILGCTLAICTYIGVAYIALHFIIKFW